MSSNERAGGSDGYETPLPPGLQRIFDQYATSRLELAITDEMIWRLDRMHQIRTDTPNESFLQAIETLAQLHETGELADTDALLARLRLHDTDPFRAHEEDELTSNEVMSRFTQLALGTPVLGLGLGDVPAGIVAGEPVNLTLWNRNEYRNTTLMPFVRAASFDVPVRTIIKTGEQVDVLCKMNTFLLRFGELGREAIARTASEVAFVTERRGTEIATNAHWIEELRKRITHLYALGMEEIDTENLDLELRKARQLSQSDQPTRHNGEKNT